MNVNYKNILLGMLGEKLVAKYLRDHGKVVDESLNVFDSNKDMLVDGKRVEVKTQAPLFYYNSFGVNTNQINKLTNVDVVYWVCVPLSTKDDPNAGCIYEMNPNISKYKIITLRTGRRVAIYSRSQDGMKIVHKISDNLILKQLNELSSSYL